MRGHVGMGSLQGEPRSTPLDRVFGSGAFTKSKSGTFVKSNSWLRPRCRFKAKYKSALGHYTTILARTRMFFFWVQKSRPPGISACCQNKFTRLVLLPTGQLIGLYPPWGRRRQIILASKSRPHREKKKKSLSPILGFCCLLYSFYATQNLKFC